MAQFLDCMTVAVAVVVVVVCGFYLFVPGLGTLFVLFLAPFYGGHENVLACGLEVPALSGHDVIQCPKKEISAIESLVVQRISNRTAPFLGPGPMCLKCRPRFAPRAFPTPCRAALCRSCLRQVLKRSLQGVPQCPIPRLDRTLNSVFCGVHNCDFGNGKPA